MLLKNVIFNISDHLTPLCRTFRL
uniref:Uncharacterized protein n=1 Tax=Anguilla anguilla TaxID=7936 RepID=A0A0E9T057_ANGAN